jgi:hypothetical protein
MIFNWDATQFCVSSDPNSSGVFIKAELPDDQPLTSVSSGNLDFTIKLYHCHHAGGSCAEPVYVIADDSMEAEDFVARRIMGLSSNNQQGSYGWLCFTKTRACNNAFYEWFGETIVCSFIEFTRECHEHCQVIYYSK